jgi:hypothetical protein
MTPPDRSLRRLWAYLDRLDAQRRDLEQRVADLERGAGGEPEAKRVPTTAAAERLGVAPVTIRRMLEAGALEGLKVALPESERCVWTVEVASLERFERSSSVAPVATERRQARKTGPQPQTAKG